MSTSPDVFAGDVVVRGFFTPNGGIQLPANSVGDDECSIGDPISASKLQHQHEKGLAQTKTSGASVAERRVIHVVFGSAAQLLSIVAGLQQALVGAATTTIDILKNGSSILTTPLVLTSSTAAYAMAAASVASPDLVAGDVLEVNITVNASTGTLGQGLFVQANFTEDAV